MSDVRNIGDLIERAYDESRPISAQLELTYKCNLLCSFCYNAPLGKQELNGDQWVATLEKLRQAGVFNITLTGGEPFCHRDFFRIAAGVRERGFTLKVYTNGVLLADRERAERYADLAPFDTEVSLHGSTASVHDRLTGIRGSFDKLMVALGHLSELGIKVTVKTPITRLNQHHLHEIDDLAARYGYKVIFDTNITPTDDGDLSPLSLAADRELLVAFFVERVRRGLQPLNPRPLESMKQNCGTGRVGMTIDPYGEMYPCVAWRRPIANVLEVEDILALWHGKGGTLNETLAYVRKIADDVHTRSLAPHAEGGFASFCPGVAEKETGDPYAFYGAARLSGMTKLAAYRAVNSEKKPADSQDPVADRAESA